MRMQNGTETATKKHAAHNAMNQIPYIISLSALPLRKGKFFHTFAGKPNADNKQRQSL